MSDAKSPPDLSMDEILTTIRRIIAEDEQSSTSATIGIAGAAAVPGSAAGASTSSGATAKEAAAAEEEVLELTDALNEDGTVRRLAPIGSSSRAAAVAPVPTSVEAFGGSQPPPFEGRREPEPPALGVGSKTESAAATRPEPELPRSEPANPPAPEAGSGSVRPSSEAGADVAAAAFARLAATPRVPSEYPKVGERPLEEIVRDELRPMLRTWLDANLPQLVERLVETEIARIVRRSGAD